MNDSASEDEQDVVEIHFLDVGQGDCTLVIDRGSMHAMVIDCPIGKSRIVIERLAELGEPSVDAVMITHWDLDHYGGALEVAAATASQLLIYNRETMMAYPVDRTVRRAQLRRLREEPFKSMRKRSAPEGTSGNTGKFEWITLAPSEDELNEAVTEFDRNLASIVVRGTAYGRTAIIAGDADGRVWTRLIDAGVDLRADVLRWPHHGGPLRGGADMVAGDLVDAVQPTHVSISVGTRNRYGHPDRQSVEAIAGRAHLACAQVTEKCHSNGSLDIATPCGGHLTFIISPNGDLAAAGGWIGHDEVVAGWSSPLCVLSPQP